MFYSNFSFKKTDIKYAKFKDSEIHAIVRVLDESLTFLEQLESVMSALDAFEKEQQLPIVFLRFLTSDCSNQTLEVLKKVETKYQNVAISVIGQPPLDMTKLSLLVYMRKCDSVERIDNYTIKVNSGNLSHYFSSNIVSNIQDTYSETELQLSYLEKMLLNENLNIAANCVRTWFYVQNIDVNYSGVVKARRENFEKNSLTEKTHYIASTGIGGRFYDKDVTSVLDSYSVGGLKEKQLGYLYAAKNMNRTSDYGVTFERGSYVDYQDRRHIFVSGTASIDNKGAVVHLGDIKAQTFRMLENIEALLKEASSGFEDLTHLVCYLRDIADYKIVKKIFEDKIPNVPYVITYAPVCRPQWLIESECMAIKDLKTEFERF